MQRTPPTPAAFEPNHLFAHRWAYDKEMSTDRILYDSQDLVTEWFGTPDEPKLPELFKEEDYAELVSLEKMKPAVGPAISTTEPGATGLYRQLCVSCHGETGQGRGTSPHRKTRTRVIFAEGYSSTKSPRAIANLSKRTSQKL